MNQVNKEGFVAAKALATKSSRDDGRFGHHIRVMVDNMSMDLMCHVSSTINYVTINYTKLAEKNLSPGALKNKIDPKELGEFYVYFFKRSEEIAKELENN